MSGERYMEQAGEDWARPLDRAGGLRPEPKVSALSGAHPSRKKPRGCRGEAWGILNPYGDIWTHLTFHSAEQAMAHVREFWAGIESVGDLSRFRPVRVKVHVTASAIEARSGETAERDPQDESAVPQADALVSASPTPLSKD